MKAQEKRMILILIIVSILIITIVWCVTRNKETEVVESTNKEEFVEVLEDGTKLNISDKLNETKRVENFEIGNIQLTDKNGVSVLLADVKNVSETSTDWTIITITLIDRIGNTIQEIEGVIKDLQPGETTQLNAATSADYANSYDFKVKIK